MVIKDLKQLLKRVAKKIFIPKPRSKNNEVWKKIKKKIYDTNKSKSIKL